MNCPKCKTNETRVTCTEHHEEFTKRYCRCLKCKHRFRTNEKHVGSFQVAGRKKGKFILNNYQCEMIGKNKYMLSTYEWSQIYKVSITTIENAKKRFRKNNPEYLPKYKNVLYDSNQMDFLYTAKNTVVSNSDNKDLPLSQTDSKLKTKAHHF